MAMIARISPTPKPAVADWTPTHLNLDAFVIPQPGLEATVRGRYDLRDQAEGRTLDATTQRTELKMNGQRIGGDDKTAVIAPEERAAMVGVRDALKGTTFLTDAKPFSDTALAANTLRMSWNDDQGARFMFEMNAMQPPAAYQAFGEAMKAYNKVAGLDK